MYIVYKLKIFLLLLLISSDIHKNNTQAINPFLHSDQNILWLTNEEVIELSSGAITQEIFKSGKNVCQFWIKVQNENPNLAAEVFKMLIIFSTLSHKWKGIFPSD